MTASIESIMREFCTAPIVRLAPISFDLISFNSPIPLHPAHLRTEPLHPPIPIPPIRTPTRVSISIRVPSCPRINPLTSLPTISIAASKRQKTASVVEELLEATGAFAD